MTIAEIIARARRLTYTSSTQYTDAQALEDLNVIYKDLTNTISQEINENYFYDQLLTTTTIDQAEYTLDDWVNNIYVNKLLGLFVKQSADGEFVKLQELTKQEWDSRGWVDNATPSYYVADKSVFISPVPTLEIVDWIKLDVILKPNKLIISSTEADIKLEDEYDYLLVEGMKEYVYMARGMINEANNCSAIYNQKKNEMVWLLSDRTSSTTNGLLPNLSRYW